MSEICSQTREAFRFLTQVKASIQSVIQAGSVRNYLSYLVYFDTAISAYWRALALPYEATFVALQGDLYVKKATLEFHASARLDDQLEVALKCERIGNASMLFTGAIFGAKST